MVRTFFFRILIILTHTHTHTHKGRGEKVLKKLIVVYIQKGLTLEYTTKAIVYQDFDIFL